MTHTDRMFSDPTYATLAREYHAAGNDLDAANDGAFYSARALPSIRRRYELAAAAFTAYATAVR